MIYAVMDGSETYNWSNSAICALVAIVMVFAILLIIIGITHLIFKGLGYIDLKKELDAAKNPAKSEENPCKSAVFDENDEEGICVLSKYPITVKEDWMYINAQYTKKFATEDISYLLWRKNIQYLKLYQI